MAATITREKPAKQTLLEDSDTALLVRREKVKVELKRLDAHLRPRIEATIRAHGTGRMVAGDRLVDLTATIRQAVSWKSVCYSQLDEATIDEVRDAFTVESTSYSAKVVPADRVLLPGA